MREKSFQTQIFMEFTFDAGVEAVDLKPEEMASKVRQEENQKIRDAAMFEAERGQKRMATTDQFQCGKCKLHLSNLM